MTIDPLSILPAGVLLILVWVIVANSAVRPALLLGVPLLISLTVVKQLHLSADFSNYLAIGVPFVFAYLAEMYFRRREFLALAEGLDAEWTSKSFLELGAIAGQYNGRDFKIYISKTYGDRFPQEWTNVTIGCATRGSRIKLVGDSVRLFGSRWLARLWYGNKKNSDLGKEHLLQDSDFLHSQSGKVFQGGIFSTDGFGLKWTYKGYVRGRHLAGILGFLGKVAGEVEKGDASRFTGTSSIGT